MNTEPQIVIAHRAELSAEQYADIVALCSRAYESEFSRTLAQFENPTHVLAYVDGKLVSHALWISRALLYEEKPLQSAYVEAVATEPAEQGKGYASYLLRQLAASIAEYDLGALSPSDPAFYSRLGWELWRGPLFALKDDVLTPASDEVMILRLPKTPALSLNASLAAPWRKGDIW